MYDSVSVTSVLDIRGISHKSERMIVGRDVWQLPYMWSCCVWKCCKQLKMSFWWNSPLMQVGFWNCGPLNCVMWQIPSGMIYDAFAGLHQIIAWPTFSRDIVKFGFLIPDNNVCFVANTSLAKLIRTLSFTIAWFWCSKVIYKMHVLNKHFMTNNTSNSVRAICRTRIKIVAL